MMFVVETAESRVRNLGARACRNVDVVKARMCGFYKNRS